MNTEQAIKNLETLMEYYRENRCTSNKEREEVTTIFWQSVQVLILTQVDYKL